MTATRSSEDLAKHAREGNLTELKRVMVLLLHDNEGMADIVNEPASKSKDTLLHMALSRNQKEIVEYLLTECSSTMINAPNRQGVTPLMKAVVSCPDLVELLLQHGANPTLRNWKGGRHKTAIDLAGDNHAMKALLQQYVVTTLGSLSEPPGCCCPHCGVELKKRTRLNYMLDSTPHVAVNAYIDDFRTSEACRVLMTQPELYHVLTNKHHLRKEITESWAVLAALRSSSDAIVDLNDTFLVDLCSGSALTVALFGILYPESKGLAVDIASKELAAHLQGNLAFLQADIWRVDFLQTMQNEVDQPSALVGMHLCGELSIRAIEIFAQTPNFQVIVLCPCCFPKKRPKRKEPRSESNTNNDSSFDFTYGSDEEANYEAWTSHLLGLLSDHCADVSIRHDKGILSKRNAMIVGHR
jgi:hypothetical protein